MAGGFAWRASKSISRRWRGRWANWRKFKKKHDKTVICRMESTQSGEHCNIRRTLWASLIIRALFQILTALQGPFQARLEFANSPVLQLDRKCERCRRSLHRVLPVRDLRIGTFEMPCGFVSCYEKHPQSMLQTWKPLTQSDQHLSIWESNAVLRPKFRWQKTFIHLQNCSLCESCFAPHKMWRQIISTYWSDSLRHLVSRFQDSVVKMTGESLNRWFEGLIWCSG